MSWSRCIVLLLLSGPSWAAGEFVIGVGGEGDSLDGVAAAVFGDVAVGDETWLAASAAYTSVDLNFRDTLTTWYADLGLDHNFGPFGVRVGAAYWGDDDVLDSTDARLAAYVRSERAYLSFNYEFRDFELVLPALDIFARREVQFDANGIGLSGRLALSDNVGAHFGGISYDYSVDLRIDENRPIVDYISVSRLSLVNSLVDYRANVGIGVDIGSRHLEFDIAQWRGAVTGSKTNSYSVRFLTPIGNRSDIEFGLGYDDSENFGEATIFSVYLYFYGGG